jgi:HSP20 family protein
MKAFGPLLEAARIQSEINRLFDNLLDLGQTDRGAGAWIPNADIVEGEGHLVVKVELPGVQASDVSLSVHGDDVILEGEKRRTDTDSPLRHHVAERSYGRFRRVIHLGVPVNTHRAEAVLGDGLLRIQFPKVSNRRGEQVTIEVITT